MTDEKLTMLRMAVRMSLDKYEAGLRSKLNDVPRGSGNADNAFDHIKASITEVKSAKRVLWMEN